MEIRLVLDDEQMEVLKSRLRTKSTADVIKEGLGLLDWATDEVGQNRVIISVGDDGSDPKRIETPGLRLARKRTAEVLNHG